MKELNELIHELKLSFQTGTVTRPLHHSFILFAYAIYTNLKNYVMVVYSNTFSFMKKMSPLQ